MYCLELLQLVSIIVSLIYVILPFVMMGHVSIVCSKGIKMTFGTKHLEPMKFWNSKGRPFPNFSGNHCSFYHGLPWRHWSSWRRVCMKSKTATRCMCFARGAVLNGKTDLELKVPIWQPYPRKHYARCKQMMRAEKIFPCVRILTLITPYPSPHTSGYIGIRIPQSVKILLVHFGIRYTAQRIGNPTNN